MATPKDIIFYHVNFAIPAQLWLLPEGDPREILLKQSKALDLPKEILFTIQETRYLHFPDFFHQHMETLHSIVEAIRKLGVYVFLRGHARGKQAGGKNGKN